MNKEEFIERLKVDYIRHKEAGTGTPILMAELENSIRTGEVGESLFHALRSQIAANNIKEETLRTYQGRVQAFERGKVLRETFGNLLPMVLPFFIGMKA